MSIEGHEEPIIRIENILLPEEMKRRFGSSYCPIVISKSGRVFINSEYFSERLSECVVEDESQMLRSQKSLFFYT